MAGQPAATSAQPLKLTEKVRAAAAFAAAIWLCYTVGGMVVRPDDPLAALSLVGHPAPLRAGLCAALLTAVAAMLATLIGPARLPGFGCAAAFLGWAVLCWPCGTMEQMLVYAGGPEAATRGSMFGRLAAETVFWGLLAGMSLLVESTLRSWLGRPGPGRPDRPGSESTSGGVPRRVPLAAATTAALFALLFISQVAARSPVAEIHRGQIYFAVGGGFLIGSLLGLYFTYRVSPWHLATAVCLAGVAAYLWAMVRPMPELSAAAYRGLLNVPPSPLVRALPVEWVALGILGSLVGNWSAHKVYVSPGGEGTDD